MDHKGHQRHAPATSLAERRTQQLNGQPRVSIGRKALRQLALHLVAMASLVFPSVHAAIAQDVTTSFYDNARSGIQPHETTLTPSNVNVKTFGKLFTLNVSGDVYAQPLYLHQFVMADGKKHNVLIVATAMDYIYAFDADGKNPAAGYLWRRLLLGAGESVVTSDDVNCTDIQPYVGVIGTPVVDRTSGTIYVVAKSKTTNHVSFIQRLHALDVATGAEKLNGPTVIAAKLPGSGDFGSTVSFNPLLNNQRSALLLAPTPGASTANSIFITWASHGDNGLYHGWVIAYNALDVSKQTGAWVDTPNGSSGGVWMSGGGLASDGLGNIFGTSGNGTFDADADGPDYGDSTFRLTLTKSGLTAGDSFTPADQSTLNQEDGDMGTVNPLLLPTQSGKIPHLLITADKTGTIYLLNRDKMGDFTQPNNSSLQSFTIGTSIHNHAAFFGGRLFIGGDNGPLEAYAFNTESQRFLISPESRSSVDSTYFGANPNISANGTENAIVWATDNNSTYAPAVLHAYNPTNLAEEYYNSAQASHGADEPANAVKFTSPIIADGKVFVGGSGRVTVYGLRATTATTAVPSDISPTKTPGK